MPQDPRNIFIDQRQQYENPNGQTPPQQTPPKNSTQQTPPQESQQQSYEERVAQMKALAEKYQREGEGQLVRDIVNNVIEQKARGQLTNEQLIAFAKRVTPLLNAEQRQRLNALVEQLIKL